ncbi:hypothetical protein JCM3765_004714 [Sporobolomyces pararoseus]
MNRLPPELLGMIADSIQQDPQPLRGQRTLSTLARTNKTFYSICNVRIYRMPILGSRKMIINWSKFYTSKANPWAICRGTEGLGNVVVPKSVSFVARPLEEAAGNGKSSGPSGDLVPWIDDCILLKSAFKTFILRDLTSVSTSPGGAFAEYFVAALLGPSKPNRRTIKELVICHSNYEPLVLFLLEALNRAECEWGDVVEDMLEHLDDEHLKLFVSQRLTLAEEVDITDDQLGVLNRLAKKMAPFDFSLFGGMDFFAWDEDHLDSVLRTRNVPSDLLSSLTTLSIPIEYPLELYLLFHSRSLPSLRHLLLGGLGRFSSTVGHAVQLLRHSITDRKGIILPPQIEEHLRDREPDLFARWDPLTEREKVSIPRIDYIGLKLDILDLSSLELLSGPA